METEFTSESKQFLYRSVMHTVAALPSYIIATNPRRQVLIDLGRKTGEFRRFSLFFSVFLAFLKIEKSVKQKDAFDLFRVVTRI